MNKILYGWVGYFMTSGQLLILITLNYNYNLEDENNRQSRA
jgi:hypothetical protein